MCCVRWQTILAQPIDLYAFCLNYKMKNKRNIKYIYLLIPYRQPYEQL